MNTSQVVTMAAATATKTKPASKAGTNATPKQKTQMHRRSRTGWFTYFLLDARAPLWTCKLTVVTLKGATHADSGGRSVMRARPCARHAST